MKRFRRGARPAGSTAQSVTRSFAAGHMDAVIRVYDDAGNVIETHQHKGDFKNLESVSQFVPMFPEYRF